MRDACNNKKPQKKIVKIWSKFVLFFRQKRTKLEVNYTKQIDQKMPDYSKGKIYIIRSPNTPAVYIGATVCPLAKRMYEHRQPNQKCSSKQVIDEGRAYIELLEDFPCERKEQLLKREGELIRATANCVNKQGQIRPNQTKEQIIAKRRQYKAKKRLIASQNIIDSYIVEILAAKTKYGSSLDETVQDEAERDYSIATKSLDNYLTRHYYNTKEKRDIIPDLHF